MLSFRLGAPSFIVTNWGFTVPKFTLKRRPKDPKKAKAKETTMMWTEILNGLSCGLNAGAIQMAPSDSVLSLGGGCLANFVFTNGLLSGYSPRFSTFALPCISGFCARKAMVPFPTVAGLCDKLSRYVVVGGTALNLGMCVKKHGWLTGLFATVLYYLFTHTPAASHMNAVISWAGITAGAVVYLRSSPLSTRRVLYAVATSCAVCAGVERAVVLMRRSRKFRGFFEAYDRTVNEISNSFEAEKDDVDPYPYYFAVPPVPFWSFPYDPFSFFYF